MGGGRKASPFILGGTFQHHYQAFGNLEFASTIEMLRDNTYVDNLKCTGNSLEELVKLKREAINIFDNSRSDVHAWESNLACLESVNMEYPSKILGHVWDK